MFETISETYKVILENGDPRLAHYFLVYDPKWVAVILVFYVVLVKVLLPKYMENRPAFQMKKIIFSYNLIQVLLSIYIFVEATRLSWNFNWRCQPVDTSNNPDAMKLAHLIYLYYMVKYSEMFETVLFVLRKKNNQVSYLHLHHHVTMVMITWGASKYLPGGHGFFIVFINSFVHIIMYIYYLVSALGPQYQKYLWWKKYITTIQLIQFGMVIYHNFQLFFYDCGYPKWTVLATIPNSFVFTYLFGKFYLETYRKNLEKKGKEGTTMNDKIE